MVAVYTGEERSMEQIRQKIEDARAAAQKKSEAYGELAEMYQALECIISWDSIYDPQYDRVISPVSRPWSINVGGYVLFCWDNYFVGFLAGLGDKCLAYSNLKEITNEAGNLSFVPNFSTARGEKSYDRSQPPVGSAMLLETYRRYREKWIVEEIYPALLEWNRWYRENRMNDSGPFAGAVILLRIRKSLQPGTPMDDMLQPWRVVWTTHPCTTIFLSTKQQVVWSWRM